MPRNYLIRCRRDSAANWVSVNPVLESGEFGFENEGRRVKVGDGVTPWSSLRYLPDILNDNGVLQRMLRDSAGASVIGRPVASTGDPSDIRALTDGHILKRSGETLIFSPVDTNSFADGAVTTEKIADSSIVDLNISNNAELSPSKLGPGFLPTRITANTPNYVEDSVTVDKLSRLRNSEGVAVWLNYGVRCYQVILPDRRFEFSIGGINPISGVFGYWPVSGAPTWTIGVPMEFVVGSPGWNNLNDFLGGRLPGLFGKQLNEEESIETPESFDVNSQPQRFGELNTQNSNPYDQSQVENEFHGIEKVYSKFAVINDTCYVSVLVNFTQIEERRSALNFTLPFPPRTPEATIVGSAYHLVSASVPEGRRRSRDRNISNRMQRIVPIISAKNTVTFLAYSDPNERYSIWDQGTKAYYYAKYRRPDRLSFNIKYEIEPETVSIQT